MFGQETTTTKPRIQATDSDHRMSNLKKELHARLCRESI